MLKSLSIRQLLLLAFLLAGLLPAMLVSFLSFSQTRNVLKQEIAHDIQALSATVANNIERMMFERIQNVHSWSQLSIMQEMNIGDIDKRLSIFLSGLAQSYGNIYHEIYVQDLHGKIIASNSAKHIGARALPPPLWFSTNFAGRSISFSNIEGNALLISEDIVDEDSLQSIGQLVAVFNWAQVQNALNHTNKKSTAAALLDDAGQLIASTSNWAEIQARHGMVAQTAFSQGTAAPGWHVRIEKLHADAVAPVHRLGYIFLGLLIGTLLLAAIMMRPIAQAITKPLSQLTDFVKSYASQPNIKPPQSGPPEVQALGAAFETMTHDLAKSQANLTRAAKLAVVGEMAAAMSHEVRTPLGILRSSADILKRDQGLSHESLEVVGFIGSETERLNKLVSTLIDAARPRALTLTQVNLTEHIKHTILLLQSQASEKNIAVVFDQNDAAIIADVDADQMQQVLLNLMMNAIQVLTVGGRIEIALLAQQAHAVIKVMDDGEGVPVAHQGQVFEPFFTKRAGGVGLGLAVVRQIVQAHGGDISYQASPMQGAQFTIKLPLKATV